MQTIRRLKPDDWMLTVMALLPVAIPGAICLTYPGSVANRAGLSGGVWQVFLIPIAVLALSAFSAWGTRWLIQKPNFAAKVGRPAMRVFAVVWTVIYTYGAFFATAMCLSDTPTIETVARLTYRVQLAAVSLLQVAVIATVVAAVFAAIMALLASVIRIGKSKLSEAKQK